MGAWLLLHDNKTKKKLKSRAPQKKLMTVRTPEGPKSFMVDLNDLRNPTPIIRPVRKSPVMPGVPHFEFEKKLTKTQSSPLIQQNPFGFTGKEYGKKFDENSKIPIPLGGVRKKPPQMKQVSAKPLGSQGDEKKKEEAKRRHSYDHSIRTLDNVYHEEEFEKSKSLDYAEIN